MANSLLTGISGLRGHQKMLEVIGNNLANVNTTAFKSSRVLFSDLMYEGQRGASSSTDGVLGSINPLQIGTGSRVSQVDLNFSQGNLEATGQALDVAIDGGGFFSARSGDDTYYTRAGAFTLDEENYLVDASTGYLVQRFGTAGEPNGIDPTFQTAGDDRILIPIGATIAGDVTRSIEVGGILPASSTGPIQQLIRNEEPLTDSSGNPAQLTTLLNDLEINGTNYIDGDSLRLIGKLPDGGLVENNFSILASSTVQDLINGINAQFDGTTTVSFQDGQISIEADDAGPSFLSLTITEGPNTTGRSTWSDAPLSVSARGKDPDSYGGSVRVYDERGSAHTLNYRLEKQSDASWDLTIDMDPTEGLVLDGLISGITFAPDGSFAQVTGTKPDGDADIAVRFFGSDTDQTMTFAFGTPGELDGLSEMGATEAAISITPDGYPPGELATVQIDADGTIFGVGSNSVKFVLAQLALAAFSNPDGLTASGSNYFQESLASGVPEIGTALSGDRGAVRAGQLEGANVDLALEFTRLIVAQRGFSANARTITVTDEVLEELTNLIR